MSPTVPNQVVIVAPKAYLPAFGPFEGAEAAYEWAQRYHPEQVWYTYQLKSPTESEPEDLSKSNYPPGWDGDDGDPS